MEMGQKRWVIQFCLKANQMRDEILDKTRPIRAEWWEPYESRGTSVRVLQGLAGKFPLPTHLIKEWSMEASFPMLRPYIVIESQK
jgi:hypothetical protein